eukprot:CAMPEP_0174697536 /NCGR_PEP_ID=MMETSP1094-20130205/3369_1 /TAXON_ID=156173 /ORGANISM="Chrysochromulina brevifilum, Strain UTEX LB 985" /LENGTH=200 /DNA_ID=CAMNT_0015894531 /DNA_START=107 /DNA_END=709 /DNA_ORIENTATION=+
MSGERGRADPARLPVRPPERCGSAAMEAGSPTGAASASGSPQRAPTGRCGGGDEDDATRDGSPMVPALMEVDEEEADAAEHDEASLSDGSRRARVCSPPLEGEAQQEAVQIKSVCSSLLLFSPHRKTLTLVLAAVGVRAAGAKTAQVDGVRWLFGAFGRGGGLLTDEPGLGKTLQIITVLEALVRARAVLRVLVLAPANL